MKTLRLPGVSTGLLLAASAVTYLPSQRGTAFVPEFGIPRAHLLTELLLRIHY